MSLILPRSSLAISTLSRESPLHVAAIDAGGPSGAAWPSANLAIFCPVVVPAPVRVRQLGWVNSTNVTDKINLGIFDRALAKVVETGDTQATGTNAVQLVNITDTDLQPGLYYLAMACNGTTSVVFRANLPALQLEQFGCFQEASDYALASPATPAAPANAYLPYCFMICGRYT